MRDETVPFNLTKPEQSDEAPKSSTKVTPKENPRDEMRRRGEEKKRLLAALRPASHDAKPQKEVKPDEPSLPLFIMDAPTVVRKEVPRVERKPQNQVTSSKTSKHVTKPIEKVAPKPVKNATSKHTDLKRQKMRDRERVKRAKDTERKQNHEQTIAHHTQSQRKTTVPIEGPVDSLREMGSMLATKLAREKEVYMNSYNRM